MYLLALLGSIHASGPPLYDGTRESLIQDTAAWPRTLSATALQDRLGKQDSLAWWLDYYGLAEIVPEDPPRQLWLERLGTAGQYFVCGIESDETDGQDLQEPGTAPVLLLFHGYMDQALSARYLLRHLAYNGHTVVSADLPGHGLSKGATGYIADFSEYGDCVAAVLAAVRRRYGRPVVLVGHSTGAAAILEYLRRQEAQPAIDGLVFIGPLVRLRSQGWAVAGARFASLFMASIPARRGGSTTDSLMRDLSKSDPLGVHRVPCGWLIAMDRWYRSIKDLEGSFDQPLLVIQGSADTTVDYSYNLPWLKRHFPAMRTAMITGARHCTHYEREELRLQAFSALDGFLDQSTTGRR